jgi:hypothetical protein
MLFWATPTIHRSASLDFSPNRRPRLVKLIAICGPLDVDDLQPAITVMMLCEV